MTCLSQMTKGNVGSLLVFDPSKLSLQSGDQLKSASSDAVAGIVTERGTQPRFLGIFSVLERAHTRMLDLDYSVADCGSDTAGFVLAASTAQYSAKD